MLPTDRISYSAITERAPLKLPDGARMAVWVIVNVTPTPSARSIEISRTVAQSSTALYPGSTTCRSCHDEMNRSK